MNNLPKKIELLANIAIIAVALLLGTVLVRQYLWPRPAAPAAARDTRIQPGTKVSLPGVEWAKSDKTLLMVLSTNCHFCTESAPFYQRLAREHGGARLVAVLPQGVAESRKYLDEHGIAVDEVRQAAPGDLGVSGTPTLIMVDGTGSVVDQWVGKLFPERETEVLTRLQ